MLKSAKIHFKWYFNWYSNGMKTATAQINCVLIHILQFQEPLDVLTPLKASHDGRKVIDFISSKKVCDNHHQRIMMRILYDYHCADNESPVK